MSLDLLYRETLEMLHVAGLLTRDAICRKTRNWPLLSATEMETILSETADFRGFRPAAFTRLQEKYCMAHAQRTRSALNKTWQEAEKDALQLLDDYFPYTDRLLYMGEGKLVVAGGAVFKAIYAEQANDIDFFFVDPLVETLDPKSAREKYDGWLAFTIGLLADSWLRDDRSHPNSFNDIQGSDPRPTSNVYVLRSEFVTTVHLVSSWQHDIKYQFIHRVYPSIGAILGGFDLGPCMMATDGQRIFATELGAWSAFSRTIMVDTSRRSTSFEYRLKKYSETCHILLPGLPANLAQLKGALRADEDDTMKYLEKLVTRQGFTTECPDFDSDMNRQDAAQLIATSTKFVPIQECRPRDETIAKMQNVANQCGYLLGVLGRCDLIPIEPGKQPDLLGELLVREAATKGYKLNVNLFAGSLFIKRLDASVREAYGNMIRHSNDDILETKRFVLYLPHANLNLETFHPNYKLNWGSPWTISGNRRRGYVNRKSDYGDNRVWPNMCMQSNVTMLLCGNLSSVVTPLILKLPGTSVVTPFGVDPGGDRSVMNMRAIAELKECTVDVTRRIRKGEKPEDTACKLQDDSRFPCMDAIMKSLHNPKFGDVQKEVIARIPEKLSTLCNVIFGQPNFSDVTKLALSNLEIVHENLTGVNWILSNPGRQWTSSINPIMENPRDWYGEYYVSFRLGCENIETCLRLLRLRQGPLRDLPKDVFSLIVRLVVWENSFRKW
jgi:hypothetical protein